MVALGVHGAVVLAGFGRGAAGVEALPMVALSLVEVPAGAPAEAVSAPPDGPAEAALASAGPAAPAAGQEQAAAPPAAEPLPDARPDVAEALPAARAVVQSSPAAPLARAAPPGAQAQMRPRMPPRSAVPARTAGREAPLRLPVEGVPAAVAATSVSDGAAAGAWRGAVAAWLVAHRRYPEGARRDGVEGRPVVRFSLDGDGVVREVVLVSSSGSGMLDEAALALFRGARLPAPPGPITVTLPIRYGLSD